MNCVDMANTLMTSAKTMMRADVPYQVFPFIRAIQNAPKTIKVDSLSVIKAPGKARLAQVTYIPTKCDVEGSCDFDPCNLSQNDIEPENVQFEVTECTASATFGFNQEQLRCMDADFTQTEYAIEALNSVLPQFRRNIAIGVSSKLLALAGVHPDGSASKSIVTTNPNTGVVNPIGKYRIEREYLDTGLPKPLLYGGYEIYNWQNMVGIGGMNNNGQNIGSLSTAGSYYDNGILGLAGSPSNGNLIISVDPTRLQFVTFNKNAGIFATDVASYRAFANRLTTNVTGEHIFGSLYDPATGLVYDLYGNSDCGSLVYKLVANYDWFVLPDICGTDGLNGIMLWTTCEEEPYVCP